MEVPICSDMGLEAVDRPLSLVLDPSRIAIVFAGGGNDGRIDQRSGLDRSRTISASTRAMA